MKRMLARLRAIPDLHVTENAPLAQYTRFGLGGPAEILADASTEYALRAAMEVLGDTSWALIGGGSNLVAADAGFSGVVLRYTANGIRVNGTEVEADSGVVLQALVDRTTEFGLQGLETMTGIPGWVGGAVYGNAGAYGHSINERITSVRFLDAGKVREFNNLECQFRYRESIFKQRKNWLILSTKLKMTPAAVSALKSHAEGILNVRNAKYPPDMKCAGSIFKNLLAADLSTAQLAQVPKEVVREGKVPSAFFLEKVGAKGLVEGGIKVADYHANLLYNQGAGTAQQVRQLIEKLKEKVQTAYGLALEEEVQYLG